VKVINYPMFCLTSDVDWASDYAISDFVSLVVNYGIKPTLFATNKSSILEEFRTSGTIDVGIHPNFLTDSTHGDDYLSVIERVFKDFPYARTFRSHCYFDNSFVTREMVNRGVKYDSNICLYLQASIVPLWHQSGIIRFPVFWEDASHSDNTNGDWNLHRYLEYFLSPGLKILSFHPFFIAANIPNKRYYVDVKGHISTISADTIDHIRYKGEGVRTFFIELMKILSSRGERFYTLNELYEMLQVDAFQVRRIQ